MPMFIVLLSSWQGHC